MHVVRFAEAPEYTAPGHNDMAMVRLQGREAGPSSDLWVGVSVIAPGGGTTLSSSPQEKMYVVLDGRLQISNGESEVALGKWDSCRIAGGEHRRIVNRTNSPATVLLAMPLSGDERQRGLRSYITGRNL
jgi:mannose-6-phosphate isomerase-like protein (cupin superfamily)